MKLLFTFLLLIFSVNVFAQESFVMTYKRSVNPQGEDEGSASIGVMGTSGYIIGGGMFSSYVPGALLYRVDDRGNVVWDTLESFPMGGSWFTSVEGTTDDGFIAMDDHGHLYKFNSNNGLQWKINSNCGCNATQFHSKLIETSSGYVLTGIYNADGALVKVDLNGTQVFAKLFSTGIGNATFLMGVKQTNDGGYISSGYTLLNGNDASVYLVKTDNAGNLQWAKAYNGPGTSDYGVDVIIAPDHGYFILDCYSSTNQTILLKTDSLGNLQWAKKYSLGAYSYPSSMVNCSGNTLVIAGSSPNYFLMKLDSSGAWVWTQEYHQPCFSIPSVVRNTPDGGFATVHCTSGYAPCRHCFIKTDSLGKITGSCVDSAAVTPGILNITSSFTVGSFPNTTSNTIAVAAVGSYLADDSVQQFVECIGTLSGIDSPKEKTDLEFSIYPDPSSGNFTIFSSEKINHVEIYDVVGEMIYTQKLNAEKTEVDLTGDAKGIYIVKLINEKGDYSIKKLIIE